MTPSSPPQRVLIVDDAPSVREALRWAIEDSDGLVVVGEAADGAEAIRRAEALLPDVVILDIEMPDLDGYETALALKALPVPPIVVFLTVHGDPASRQRGLAAGADGFVEKGGGWAALLGQIHDARARRYRPR